VYNIRTNGWAVLHGLLNNDPTEPHPRIEPPPHHSHGTVNLPYMPHLNKAYSTNTTCRTLSLLLRSSWRPRTNHLLMLQVQAPTPRVHTFPLPMRVARMMTVVMDRKGMENLTVATATASRPKGKMKHFHSRKFSTLS
jgi:hypothetical protein